ncbi:MAG: hypothetical protein GY925_24105 [Actinomycetia bacterium]|nr:hypothetical protein [Actinomycetes bacterium]
MGRNNLRRWQEATSRNVYHFDDDFAHTIRFHLGERYPQVHEDLSRFGAVVPTTLEEAVNHGDFRLNLPRIDRYNGIGERDDHVVHDHSYPVSGDLIYGTGVVTRLARLGGLTEGFAFHYVSNHAGDTGHHCPVICNYETTRLLRSLESFPDRDEIIAKLEEPSFSKGWTSSQFLTEVQGGSDVGANDTRAWQADDGTWRIRGEKWFCSNANANIQVITARFDTEREGTRGLAMFLVPALLPDGTRNHFTFRRLKEKFGTRALASAEIDYHDAHATPLGPLDEGFKNLMKLVIHHSRITMPIAMGGMLSRAYQLSRSYADTRHAFGKAIIEYPLVQENLAHVKTDLLAGTASSFAVAAIQDDIDTGRESRAEMRAFCRLMANVNKAVWCTRILSRIQDAAEIMAGNGMIEQTSSMPRLIRDAMTMEKWEGSQNTMRMQVLRDIERLGYDQVFLTTITELGGEIDTSRPERAALDSAIDHCRRLFDEIRNAPFAQQTLLSQRLLVQLGDTFAYWALVREGIDQATDADDHKLSAAELFHRQHLEPSAGEFDDNYLALIAHVVDGYKP